MGSKRASAILSPPISPSPTSIPRPSSSMSSVRPRLSSDASTVMGDGPETRNVRVVLRLRPSDPNDPSVPPRFRTVLVHPTSPSEVRLDIDPAALAGQAVGSSHAAGKRHPLFNFDHVLGEQATQTELYDVTTRETVDEFMRGHNITFLAYGQTSSGKSYSMGTTGEEVDYSGTEFTPRTGLIPRTVHTIFEKAEEIRQQSGPGASWECRLSFLELYNEEIIDLLSGSGVAIQIREERDGRIVWAGVKEVKVKSLEEVMQLLQDGSERRKTGETSMNATSSRSHAIFSLTLVQKKRSGVLNSPTGIPRSETPTRQLRRPSSTIGLPGPRSPTPSSARGGPPSSFGRATPTGRPMSMQPPPTPNTNEYVITTSKFNMVDLAGSERLKRTAAQGDRMKEGISINSGLLALGNVISTLCDPVKARGHIPYRDSKLTRMLQDSIGGNSLTTMIACVSPIEANIGETINTIKYASRARNIRNQAKINQVEAGWDDVEHLQSTVTKLRKQLAMLMEDGESPLSNGHSPIRSEDSIRQSEKLIQRLAELQREHTELYDRYLQKCSENMRLSGELRSRGPIDSDASSKFNEMVEPVILEYEKVVSALNQQLDELRGELSAMSEMQDEQNRQLQEARVRQTQSELYVSELRSRLAKLTERNTSSEAYIHDLEAKLKLHAEKEDSHSDAIAELKKDIAKLRENNATSNQHTSQLEARLSKSETTATSLAAQVEKQEKEAERREAAYRDLEEHIALLDTTKDNKLLLEELDQRDKKIAELEKELEEKAASEEQERLQLLDAVHAEKSIQAELRSRLASMQASSAADSLPTPSSPPRDISAIQDRAIVNSRSSPLTSEQLTPPDNSQESHNADKGEDDDEVQVLKQALRDLSEKFSNAESRVADLTTQLSEARLVNAEIEDTVPPSPSPGTEDEEETLSEAETTLQTPRDSMSATSPSRRRGSMPILSATKTMGQGAGFRGGRGYGDSAQMRPQSLSQELSSAQSLGTLPRASWTPIQSHSRSNSLLLSSPSSTNSIHTLKPSRSNQSLEAELKFVHRVVEERDEELKDREAYIKQLEESLQKKHIIPSLKPSATINTLTEPAAIAIPATPKIPRINMNIPITPPRNIPLPNSPRTPLANLAKLPPAELAQQAGHAQQNGELYVPVQSEMETGGLSPKSAKRFSQLKDTLNLLENGGRENSEAQDKIDDLMKEMFDKEESQKKIIEQQFIQIADLQKTNNKLKEELNEREISPPPQSHTAELEELKKERNQLIAERAESFPFVPSTPADDVVIMDRMKAEHAEDLRSLTQGHKDTITVLQAGHVQALDKLKSMIEHNEQSHRVEIEELQSRHDAILTDLQSRHAERLDAIQEESNMIAEEMEKSLSQSEEERRQLKMRADQALFELSRIRDEHALQRNNDAKSINELTKVRSHLENVRVNLENTILDLTTQNENLNQKITELGDELKESRKSVNIPPPQGPPPTTPLPPLPKKRSMGNMKLDLSSPTSANGFKGDNGPSSADYFGRNVESNSNHSHTTSEAKEQINKLISEKDLLCGEKEELLGEKEDMKKEMKIVKRKVQDVENKLMEEKVKVTNLTFDLRESQKQNTKLRSHLEESKREVKQLTDTCNLHITELNARRQEANRFSEEGHKNRDSLQAAQAQVETLKRQLDKAVEKKVNKKLLGCF